MNHSIKSRKFGLYRSVLLGSLAIATFSTIPAHAHTYVIVHQFNDGSIINDGKSPYQPPVMGPDGNFYGVTQEGGSANYGIAYVMTPSGTVSVLHHFGVAPSEGRNPTAGLTLGSDGNFYGVTVAGGSASYGTVFKMTPSGAVTDLHSFGSHLIPSGGEMVPDGCWPANSPLVSASDGNIYGTTRMTCGDLSGGRFYRINVATGVYTVRNAWFGKAVRASGPQGIVQNAHGNFIGVSSNGGSGTDTGTIFDISPDGLGWVEYQLPPIANGPRWPLGAVSTGSVDGYVYAVSGSNTGLGDLFKVPQNAINQVTVLHRFSDGSVANDGMMPAAAPIQLSDGSLIGTAAFGGQYGGGVIYEISASGVYSIVHQFGSVSNDGNLPFCLLYKAPDGNIYGTTWAGGTSGAGVIFKLVP